jgi:PAS domain-containing protein
LRYIRVNDEFCRFVGASREEILGRRIVEGPVGGLDRDMVERVLTEQVLAGAWQPNPNTNKERKADQIRQT